MTTLAFDTSADTLNCSLQTKDGQLYGISKQVGLRNSELLLPTIGALLHDASIKPEDLELIVCAKGPGSFTGLRIGMAAAKGIALGLSCPLVSVPTLDALADGLDFFAGIVIPVIDAKKKRVYAALYQKGTKTSEYLDIGIDELCSMVPPGESVLFTGPGTCVVKHLPKGNDRYKIHSRRTPDFCSLIRLGEQLLAAGVTESQDSGPLYIRKSDAELKGIGGIVGS